MLSGGKVRSFINGPAEIITFVLLLVFFFRFNVHLILFQRRSQLASKPSFFTIITGGKVGGMSLGAVPEPSNTSICQLHTLFLYIFRMYRSSCPSFHNYQKELMK